MQPWYRISWLALFAVWFLPAPAKAQLQLFIVDAPGSERLLTGVIQIGEVSAGDYRDVVLRIRNTGQAAVTLERFRVTGQGFSLRNYPSIPFPIAPGSNLDFTVRFRPTAFGTYSGTLYVNDAMYLLVAKCPPSLTVQVEQDGTFRPLTTDQPVSFGQVEHGQQASRKFRLENPTGELLTVRTLTIDNPVFQLATSLPLPLPVPASTAVEFTIVFRPDRPGVHIGKLQVDERSFRLEAYATDPPFPPLELEFDASSYSSGQQGAVSVKLREPAPVTATGQLTVELEPDKSLPAPDPSVQFLANGKTAISFTVGQGEQLARFGNATQAWFQTGTVSGRLVFRARLSNQTREVTLVVAPRPVVIDSGTLERIPIGLRLQLRAFDNTLSTAAISFVFYDRQGKPLPPGKLDINVRDMFATYFRNSVFGGLFRLQADFPVAGDVSLIGAVELRLDNEAGSSEAFRINAP